MCWGFPQYTRLASLAPLPNRAPPRKRVHEPRGREQPRPCRQIGRAHVLTPVTNAHLVCRLLLEKKKYNIQDPVHTNRHSPSIKTTQHCDTIHPSSNFKQNTNDITTTNICTV